MTTAYPVRFDVPIPAAKKFGPGKSKYNFPFSQLTQVGATFFVPFADCSRSGTIHSVFKSQVKKGLYTFKIVTRSGFQDGIKGNLVGRVS